MTDEDTKKRLEIDETGLGFRQRLRLPSGAFYEHIDLTRLHYETSQGPSIIEFGVMTRGRGHIRIFKEADKNANGILYFPNIPTKSCYQTDKTLANTFIHRLKIMEGLGEHVYSYRLKDDY